MLSQPIIFGQNSQYRNYVSATILSRSLFFSFSFPLKGFLGAKNLPYAPFSLKWLKISPRSKKNFPRSRNGPIFYTPFH